MNAEAQSRSSQSEITPQGALALLKEGNQRFVERRPLERDLLQQVRETGKGQYPFAMVLGCVDSRVPPELIFDQGIGDIFSARIAGNFVNQDILGSMEFATKVAGAKLILVLGHTKCGAIQGAAEEAQLGNLTGLLAKLKPAVAAVNGRGGSEVDEFVERVVEKNVELTVEAIRDRSSVLRTMLDSGEIALAGAIYDVDSGRVAFL